MEFVDAQIEPLRNVNTTPEGYLVADAFAVRTGVQKYLGSEVGRPELSVVNVYRPGNEVFHKDSVATFAHKPVTVDHPPGGVDASTWKDRAVGEVSTEAMRDGERLKLQLIVKDATAIADIQSGKRRQLSAGYRCQLDWTPGVTEAGETYDAVQRDIQINHLALVEQGRAGNCAIGDSAWGVHPVLEDGAAPRNTKEVPMDIATLVLGDAAVKVVAEDESKVAAYIARFGEVTADNETLRGTVAALEKQIADSAMTPQKLLKLVADRAAVSDGFKAITGDDAPAELADTELRRMAVTAKLGDAAKDMSDDAIAGAFKAFTSTKDAPKDKLRQGIMDGGGVNHSTAPMNDKAMAELFDFAGVPMKKEA